jgi:hypothetical protein
MVCPLEIHGMAIRDIVTNLIGAKPTVASIEESIATQRASRVEFAGEIERIGQSRASLVGDAAAIEKASRDMAALKNKIEDIDLVLPSLVELLTQANARARVEAIARHKAASLKAFENLEVAIAAASRANEAAKMVWDAAWNEIGSQDVHLHLVPIAFHSLLVPDLIDHWRDTVRGALFPGEKKHQPVAQWGKDDRPAAPAPYRREDDVMQLGHVRKPLFAPMPSVLRDPRREEARPGDVLVKVVRSGYPDREGKQCIPGDIISVRPKTAEAAHENGAVEYLDEAAA